MFSSGLHASLYTRTRARSSLTRDPPFPKSHQSREAARKRIWNSSPSDSFDHLGGVEERWWGLFVGVVRVVD